MSLSKAAPNLEELELMGTSDDTLASPFLFFVLFFFFFLFLFVFFVLHIEQSQFNAGFPYHLIIPVLKAAAPHPFSRYQHV